MSEIARTLRDRRLNVWERAKEIADKATEENRALTPEEQGGWDQANDELNKLDARIKSVLEAEKRSRDADDAFDAITGKTHDAVRRAAGRPDAGDNEIRRWLRGENGTSRVLELTRDPNRGPINYRSLLNTPALSGGAMVPTDFYDQLLAHLIEVSGVLQTGPTIVNTAGGEPLQFPGPSRTPRRSRRRRPERSRRVSPASAWSRSGRSSMDASYRSPASCSMTLRLTWSATCRCRLAAHWATLSALTW